MLDALNLEKQLTFYGAYHHNPVNIGIHMVCVPLILLTSFLFGTNTAPLLPDSLAALFPVSLPPTLGTLSMLGYLIFYLLLEPRATLLLSPVLISAVGYFNHLTTTSPGPANTTALAIFGLSWGAQFVGHGVFEGRAPALFDNLAQALLLAPFFVWLEVLFWCGYRPAFRARVENAVKVEVDKFQREKAKKGPVGVNGKVYGGVEQIAKNTD